MTEPERHPIPEKARLLHMLTDAGFNVPPFIYVPADAFDRNQLTELEDFLTAHRSGHKVIARSAHPMESFFKGGTFDSLETYADKEGITYARTRIIKLAQSAKRLSILRQQKFYGAPDIDLEDMGVVVMPFVEGASVMAKRIENRWEFGYCRDRTRKVQCQPYITETPHDVELLRISEQIESHLGFRCEIEFIISTDNEIHVVQAKDISRIEVLEKSLGHRTIRLDGIRRIRRRRNFRERPVFVLDNRAFYMTVIDRCEEMLGTGNEADVSIQQILDIVSGYEATMEDFCLRHQRFGIIDLTDAEASYLYQIANHYLEEYPEDQKRLSKALYNHQYRRDAFFSEADTLVTQDTQHISLSSHDAYGIDTVRVPFWTVYWDKQRHQEVSAAILRLGFKTGDTVAIEVDVGDRPSLYRV